MFARVRVSAAHAHELAAVVVAAAVAVWSAGGDFVGGRVETSRRVHDAQLHDATAGRSRPLAPLHPHPDAGGGCASRARGRRRRGDEDPFRDEDAAKSGLDRIEDISRRSGYTANERAFVRLSEEYLAARPNQALPAPDAPAGTNRDASAGESANPPAPPGSSQAPRRRRAPLRTPVASLHGVGAYASDAHAMFCEGLMGVAPRDHALRWWYAGRWNGGRATGGKPREEAGEYD